MSIDDLIKNKVLTSTFLTVMFILSGHHKINNFTKTVDNVKSKINLDMNDIVYKVIIVGVILLEILAPAMIIYHSATGKYKEYAYYSIIALIIFTILVTFIYHPFDITNYYKSIPFLANLSLIGGLLLLLSQL